MKLLLTGLVFLALSLPTFAGQKPKCKGKAKEYSCAFLGKEYANLTTCTRKKVKKEGRFIKKKCARKLKKMKKSKK